MILCKDRMAKFLILCLERQQVRQWILAKVRCQAVQCLEDLILPVLRKLWVLIRTRFKLDQMV